MDNAIAIVGMACEYPDASSPEELWLNALAQRRSFRRIPPERLDLDSYWSSNRNEIDLTYCTKAALLKNYKFDRLSFRISGPTFRATDFTHWLALATASKALSDAFTGHDLSRSPDNTGVFVGNSLTGEFSRAALMRVRWPFVRDVLEQQLLESGWTDGDLSGFLQRCEEKYKSHFEPYSEDSLPGGLSNTIAGRICNFFDFKGGGYVVDGACASSLLAVINGCAALASRDIDVAVCGGVDLSLDPFELVGFARNGALASDEMRVFDSNPTGFLPGEGCGFVVLVRQDEAQASGRPIHAVIRGWGISSDGQGGMTRPEPEGQLLAIKRAWARASLDPAEAAYFEAHGTGTAAGDAAELTALCRAASRNNGTRPAVVGSIKANIGHTKAAAGVAGVLKTVMALQSRCIPPTTGCVGPHAILVNNSQALQVQSRAVPWPADRGLLAGVSAMGFGGINTHLVLEGGSTTEPLRTSVQVAANSWQDAELCVFSGGTSDALRHSLESTRAAAGAMSSGELSDLSAYLLQTDKRERWKAAVVASSPEELSQKLERLLSLLAQGDPNQMLYGEGIFLRCDSGPLRLGLLFPGQGIPYAEEDWDIYTRVVHARSVYAHVEPWNAEGETEKAQVGIALQCLKQLRILKSLNIRADAAVGHSLGELVALSWSGALTEDQLLEMARLRGQMMEESSRGTRGAMLAVVSSDADGLAAGDLVIAARNGSHIVISGPEHQIATAERQCSLKGIRAVRLPVKYAFHSTVFNSAAHAFEQELRRRNFGRVSRNVFSTVTGDRFDCEADLAAHLARQLISPVLFADAVSRAARNCDLFLEVGSEGVLAAMAAAVTDVPTISWTPASVKPLLLLAAALYATGSPLTLNRLVESRYVHKYSPTDPAQFLRSPCAISHERTRPTAAKTAHAAGKGAGDAPKQTVAAVATSGNGNGTAGALQTVMQIVSKKIEMPMERLSPTMNLLIDLHVSSIAVAEIAAQAARSLGKIPLQMPTSTASKTIEQLAAVLEQSQNASDSPASAGTIQGVDGWVAMGQVRWRPAALREFAGDARPGEWTIAGAESVQTKAIADRLSGKLSGDGLLLLYDGGTPMETVLRCAQEVCARPRPFLVVCDATAPPIAGFVRSVVVEANLKRSALLTLELESDGAVDRIVEESGNAAQFADIRYIDGKRCEPTLQFVIPPASTKPALSSEDNVLVLGGGKGIAAECAFELARRYGCSLALVGRSSLDSGGELTSNLARLSKAGIRFEYCRADVTKADELCRAVEAIQAELGPVTAVVHATGNNEPKALAALTVAEIEHTVQPKLEPLQVLERCLDFRRLKAFVGFGSIISRIGFHGEAHYAHANELLRERMEQLAATYNGCRFLCLEYSVWSGLGMGENLGRVEALTRMGIAPLTPEMGTEALFRALESETPPSVVVTSRIPAVPTLNIGRSEVGSYRFLERKLVDYPGVELIFEADLSSHKDLYLEDHKLEGTAIFPAALALEAITEAATALLGSVPNVISDVRFASAITVEEGRGTTIRIATLRRSESAADVVIRSSATGFQVDHFRATCSIASLPAPKIADVDKSEALCCEDLYDAVLFQRGRFQSVQEYYDLATRSSCALLKASEHPWFSQFLPKSLLLLSPSVIDGAMHSIQACIPHKRLIPTAIERVTCHQEVTTGASYLCRAHELWANENDFRYDLTILDDDGKVLQQWSGLALHAIVDNDLASIRTPRLIANMLERRWAEIAGDASVDICLHDLGSALRAIHKTDTRADGKPAPTHPSEAHAWSDKFLLRLRSAEQSSCDLERVVHREPQVWHDLLGDQLFQTAVYLADERSEELNLSATRVWCVAECLKKLGRTGIGATVENHAGKSWAVMLCGDCLIGTVLISVEESPVVAAFARQSANIAVPLLEAGRAAISL